MNVAVELERPGEEAESSRIVAEAFGDAKTPALLRAMRRSSAWRGLSYLAKLEGKAVGHVSLIRGWLDAPRELIEVLVMSPVSVEPGWQGKGIGTEMLTQVLELLKCRPEPLVFLEGNPKFYSRVGFRGGVEAGFRAPSLNIPSPAFQYFALPGYRAESMTGTLVYPDVFWEMDSVGLRSG